MAMHKVVNAAYGAGLILWHYVFFIPIALVCVILVIRSCQHLSSNKEALLWPQFRMLQREVCPYLALGHFVAFSTYAQLALNWNNYIPEWHTGYGEQKGLKTVVTISVSALSFMLIFRLQRSRSRWWEARSHLGKIIASLKCVVVHCVEQCDPQMQKRVVVLSKLLFECTRCSLSTAATEEEDEPSLQNLLSRVSGPDYSFYKKHDRQSKSLKNRTASARFFLTGDSDDDGESEDEDENAENPFLQKRTNTISPQSLLSEGQIRQFEEAESLSSRVLLIWKWLYLASRGNTGSMKGVGSFNKQLHDCLHSFHGASKIKAHGAEVSGLDIVEWWVMHLLLTLLYPISLAYEFHQGYTRKDFEIMTSLNVGRLLLFGLSISLLVYFLCALQIVAEDARDPFGSDQQDIPMDNMAKTFCKEIDVLGTDERII